MCDLRRVVRNFPVGKTGYVGSVELASDTHFPKWPYCGRPKDWASHNILISQHVGLQEIAGVKDRSYVMFDFSPRFSWAGKCAMGLQNLRESELEETEKNT